MKITLAQAFRYRNLLKRAISVLSSKLQMTSTLLEKDQTESGKTFDGLTYNQAVEKNISQFNHLIMLRKEIDKANISNKEKITELEGVKAKLAFVKELNERHGNPNLFKLEDNETGGKRRVEMKSVFDKDRILELMRTYKKEQLRLENELAAANATTTLEVDVEAIEELIQL